MNRLSLVFLFPFRVFVKAMSCFLLDTLLNFQKYTSVTFAKQLLVCFIWVKVFKESSMFEL